MRLSIFTEPQQGASYDDLLALARTGEDAGFDAFFRSDHYLVMGDGDGLPGPSDAWVTLAGLARDTTRLRLGTLVSPATFRLPGPLAIQVAQVDAMSGGRVELGLGAGWFEAEHAAYGIPFPPVAERFDRLAEQLEVITGLWTTPVGETYSFTGEHYRLADSPGLPKPVQERVPIIVGGAGRARTPELAARYATEFNAGFCDVAESAARFERVRAACERIGRPAGEIAFSWAGSTLVGRDDAELARRAAKIGADLEELRGSGMVGTPQQVVQRMGEFAEVGVSRLHLQLMDLSDLDHAELIGAQVIPQLG
jgi:F420-dependent oxidoreductase-like protein